MIYKIIRFPFLFIVFLLRIVLFCSIFIIMSPSVIIISKSSEDFKKATVELWDEIRFCFE